MTGEERRNDIFNTIQRSQKPISGAALAQKYQVSRQIIVKDIGLLRAVHPEIYSTARGYQITALYPPQRKSLKSEYTSDVQRIFHVAHTDEEIEDELNTIVDIGGKVVDVFVEHEIYGSICADLRIHCRRHVQEFMEGIRNGKSSPLKNLTSGIHYHTVDADSEETLNLIEKALKEKGYLIS